MAWQIINNNLYNDEFITLSEFAVSKPYPNALWRIEQKVNQEIPFTKLMISVPNLKPDESSFQFIYNETEINTVIYNLNKIANIIYKE